MLYTVSCVPDRVFLNTFRDEWHESLAELCIYREELMSKLKSDAKGFTCECGLRNDFPSYARDHWDVKLLYNCSCDRRYVLYRGNVTIIARPFDEVMDSEAFGD